MSSSNRWIAGATVWKRRWKRSIGALILRGVGRASSEANDEGTSTTSVRGVSLSRSLKKILRVDISTGNSPNIHSFSTLDRCEGRDYPWSFMTAREYARIFLVACVLIFAKAASAADEATLFRLFLKDGGTLVSYGEIARVGDRVVFSMPTSAGPNPALHLVNIAADRVDWDRTERYAASARSGRYLETQAESDYTTLSNQVTELLAEVARTDDPGRRLAIIEDARKTLAEWPANHYNYREADIRQMLTMLDVAIADIRATSGQGRFNLNLVAFATQPPPNEPLLPAPTLRESIEQVLTVARLSESSADRVSLLRSAVSELENNKDVGDPALPADWVVATTTEAQKAIDAELRTDRAYRSLSTRMIRLADQRARSANVRGVENLLAFVRSRDDALGNARPDEVNSLMAVIEERLDAARRLRLARDRWLMRAPDFQHYRVAINAPLDLFAQLRPALEDIKSLAGSTPYALQTIERLVAQIIKLAGDVSPPEEFTAAQALLVSAAHLAENAATIRRDATLSGSIQRAWDASSAAAGALMLGTKARTDIRALLRQPQLQ
jgi:hypothetical protein